MKFHLLVLVHGLWGNPTHFDYILQQIEQRNLSSDSEQLVVYRTKRNEGYKTLDGIDVCGLRVASEIREQIDQINKEGEVSKLSIVGYSLGGLISRFAIGILYHQGLFDTVEPINFTTFCTPHVGVLTPGSNISVQIFNTLIPSLLSLSGKQMFLKDESIGKYKCALLNLMANSSSVFYKALKSFRYRSLYANAINDKRTAWWTSGISIVDPFLKIDEKSDINDLNFIFVDKYDPVVIDSTVQFDISNRSISSSAIGPPLESNFWTRKWNWVVVASNLLFLAPLWVFWFITSSILESYKSRRRITSALKDNHSFFSILSELNPIVEPASDEVSDDVSEAASETGSMRSIILDEITDYNIEQSLQDRADTLMESVWDAMTSKDYEESAKLARYDLISAQEHTDDSATTLNSGHTTDSIKASIDELSFFEKGSPEANNEVLKVFTLDLSAEQLEIVKSLNELGWEKYPILIRNTKSTHSAAIVRNVDEVGLYEGKTVVRHWLDNVLKLK